MTRVINEKDQKTINKMIDEISLGGVLEGLIQLAGERENTYKDTGKSDLDKKNEEAWGEIVKILLNAKIEINGMIMKKLSEDVSAWQD